MLDGTLGEGAASVAPDLKTLFPTHVNVTEGDLCRNIRANAKRGLPELPFFVEPHDRIALIVGGGPSLKDYADDIWNRQQQGATVFALNGAAKFLAEPGRDVVADHVVLLDARTFMPRFVAEAPEASKLLIASQCDGAVFDAAKGRDVTLWHRNFDGVTGVWTESRLIGAGTTVGMSAIQIAIVLGYRNIHLYGMDSSYCVDDGHAYAQPENAGEETIEVEVEGIKYRAAIWMVSQVVSFQSIASELCEEGVEINVHGWGLLPHIAKKMGTDPVEDGVLTMMYDLASSPVGFNFLEWLLTADILKTQCGAERLRVVFAPGPNEGFRRDTLPESLSLRRQMYENVVKPAMKLIGAEDGGIGCFGGTAIYTPAGSVRKVRDEGAEIPRFKASAEAKAWARAWLAERGLRAPIVVTLREAEHWPEANSDRFAWLEFATWARKHHGEDVVFVRDTRFADETLPGAITCPEASLDLDKRCALYEVARLNMLKCNGPYILASCVEGDVPLLIFGVLDEGHITLTPANWKRLAALDVGDQFPWYTARQRLVWEGADTLPDLIREYERIAPLL